MSRIWKMKDGREVRIADMNSIHLANAIRAMQDGRLAPDKDVVAALYAEAATRFCAQFASLRTATLVCRGIIYPVSHLEIEGRNAKLTISPATAEEMRGAPAPVVGSLARLSVGEHGIDNQGTVILVTDIAPHSVTGVVQ